ncbi:putative DUF1752 domain protein [Rosellinia necatrix]|uniref:Putative DUF1752 domain protein n=1 Tax=Rosellinia necatrix TaxID=77044 RepID=A0A1W2TEX4_ROSNE|nr:putative DUF1752 domain protein [Rosellinia necatrix]
MAQEQTILPKGIVLNREAVYDEIAIYEVMPVEQILRARHVFSTTSKKLYDPTARRLENFWTRVLGGDRRHLPGRVLSRLFKDISEETSFVKLRGPSNRYEPPSPGSSVSTLVADEPTRLTATSELEADPSTVSTKTLHPILKKSRRPSTSRPRPTTRFLSPPVSRYDEGDIPPSGSATPPDANPINYDSSPGSPERPTIKEGGGLGHGRKALRRKTAFAASTARQRPKMPRRSSSQASAAPSSDIRPKEGESSRSSKLNSPQSSAQAVLENQGKQSSITNNEELNTTLSAKAAGKRPMTRLRIEKTTLKPKIMRINQHQNQAPPAEGDSTEAGQEREAQSRKGEKAGGSSSTAVGNRDAQRPGPGSSMLMTRSSSDVGPARPTSREVSRSFVPSSSLMSSTLAKLDTSVIGQGTIAGFGGITVPASRGEFREGSVNAAHDAVARGSRIPAPLFNGQMAPTEARDTVPIPLARTRGQLAILLDRKADKKSRR